MFTANSNGSMLFSSARVFCWSGVICICVDGCSSEGWGRSMKTVSSLNLIEQKKLRSQFVIRLSKQAINLRLTF
jgi:hypothetical protein